MKKLFLILFLFICLQGYSQQMFEKINMWHAGIDVGQFTYLVTTEKKGFNAAVTGQYKPFYFLALNSSFTYNDINRLRRNGYDKLVEYHSRGACLKLGFDVSVRLSRKERNTRAFIGCQFLHTIYSESGRFQIENYWGDHIRTFEVKDRYINAGEIILGFQFAKKRWLLRPQFYFINLKDDIKFSNNDEIVKGYYSPFIPGFGFNRGGLNLIFAYRIGKVE